MAHSTDEMENKGVNTIPNYRKWVADNIKVKAHVGGGILEECVDNMLSRLDKIESDLIIVIGIFHKLQDDMTYDRKNLMQFVQDVKLQFNGIVKDIELCQSTPTPSVGLPDPILKPSARSKKASKL